MADPGGSLDPLDALFEKLAKNVQNEKHRTALKTVDEILKLAPQDEDAHKVKVAALLQLEEWENALVAISKSPDASSLIFEKAYAQYKLKKIDEALQTLEALLSGATAGASSAHNVVPALELAAQLHYRMDRTQPCLQLYDTIIKKHKVDELDVKTNIIAAHVAAGLTQEIPSLMAALKVTTDASFELAYNRACGLVEQGEWASAEAELRRALKRGRETLFSESDSDQPITEEEVEEELAPLTVQLAYVLGRLGRTSEAQELYDNVLRSKSELDDAPTRAVAINNSFADTGRIDTNPEHKKTVAGAAKKLESLLQDATKPGQVTLIGELEVRLSGGQKQLLTLNRALVYLLAGRLEPARQLAAQLAAQAQTAPAEAAHAQGIVRPSIRGPAPHLLPLLQAALMLKDGKEADADSLLQQFAASHPSHALEPTLARAQLALEAGQLSRAAELLGAASNALPGPPRGALVATQASLLTQVEEPARAEGVLQGALSSLSSASPATVAWCLESLMSLQLQLGKAQDAQGTFAQLQQAAGGHLSANALALLSKLLGALASAGSIAPATLTNLTRGLPSLTAELRNTVPDVEALEANCLAASKPPVPASQQVQQAAQDMDVDQPKAAAAPAAAASGAKKKSKKRKRYPKGWDHSLPGGGLPPPDPERWLPKWQRSDAKKKKLKSSAREKGAVKGSQGAGKVNENLDRTKPGSSQPSLPARQSSKKGKR